MPFLMPTKTKRKPKKEDAVNCVTCEEEMDPKNGLLLRETEAPSDLSKVYEAVCHFRCHKCGSSSLMFTEVRANGWTVEMSYPTDVPTHREAMEVGWHDPVTTDDVLDVVELLRDDVLIGEVLENDLHQ